MYHYRVHFLVRTEWDALTRLEDMGLIEVTDRSWWSFNLKRPNDLGISNVETKWLNDINPLAGAILSVDTNDYMEAIIVFEALGVGHNVSSEALVTSNDPYMLLGLWVGRERIHYDTLRREYCVRGLRSNDKPHHFDTYDKLINYVTPLGGMSFQSDPLCGRCIV